MMFRWSFTALCLSTLSLSAFAASAPVPPLDKVMIVIFENADYSATVKQPFFARLAKEGADLSNMNAELHPSQGNYIALTSGNTFGVTDDGVHTVNALNIVDLLEASGKTWKAYVEAWPGKCYTGAKKGTYVRKHNPFISYKNIAGSPTRCARIVDASELQRDVEKGSLPDYSFYVPDLNNDGHDTDMEFADKWYAGKFGPLLVDPRFMKGMTLISTLDESSLTGGNRIYTTFYGEKVKAGASTKNRYDHYSLLRTIEMGMGLQDLSALDAKASPVADIWK